jgi:uncharacterized protein (DUF2236 family)
VSDLRSTIRTRVRGLVGSGEVDLSRPPGDDGLFGPGSAPWRIHGDFTSMIIGGVSALLLQMLHPRALAGVWDHSDFRRDRHGRLKRTAAFISVTTFGSTAKAEAMIARVRRVHDRVAGTLPDGTPYSANDPELLTFVHVAEVDSFLRAHLRYKDAGLPGAVQDRYLTDYAEVARRLGAEDVPTSRREIAEYYRRIRPELRFDARTRDVAQALLARGDEVMAEPMRLMVFAAGRDLLPDWAAAMHGSVPALAAPAIRSGARGMGRVLRWALSAQE